MKTQIKNSKKSIIKQILEEKKLIHEFLQSDCKSLDLKNELDKRNIKFATPNL